MLRYARGVVGRATRKAAVRRGFDRSSDKGAGEEKATIQLKIQRSSKKKGIEKKDSGIEARRGASKWSIEIVRRWRIQ